MTGEGENVGVVDDVDDTELVEEFRKSGSIPILWQWMARYFISAANTLEQARTASQAKGAGEQPRRDLFVSHVPSMLLYGLALELLLKALRIAQGVDATAGGTLSQHVKTHNLLSLWQQAGLPLTESKADLLRRLRYSIEAGKYPVGVKPDPEAPTPTWVALTSRESILSLLNEAEDALRATGGWVFEKEDLAGL